MHGDEKEKQNWAIANPQMKNVESDPGVFDW